MIRARAVRGAAITAALVLATSAPAAGSDGPSPAWTEPSCETLDGRHPPSVAAELDRYEDALGVPFVEWDDARIQRTVDLAARCEGAGHDVDAAYWLSSLKSVVGGVAGMSSKVRHVERLRAGATHADSIPPCETVARFDAEADLMDRPGRTVVGRPLVSGDPIWLDELVEHANWCRAYLPDFLSKRDGRLKASTLRSLEGFMDHVTVVGEALEAWSLWDVPGTVRVEVDGEFLPPTLASRTVADLVRFEGRARATLHGASSEEIRRGMRWAGGVLASEEASRLDHAYASLVRQRFVDAIYDTEGTGR